MFRVLRGEGDAAWAKENLRLGRGEDLFGTLELTWAPHGSVANPRSRCRPEVCAHLPKLGSLVWASVQNMSASLHAPRRGFPHSSIVPPNGIFKCQSKLHACRADKATLLSCADCGALSTSPGPSRVSRRSQKRLGLDAVTTTERRFQGAGGT